MIKKNMIQLTPAYINNAIGTRLSLGFALGLCLMTSHGCLANTKRNLTPQPNPHSTHFFTIQGKIAPTLVKYFNIHWHADYISLNPACKTYTNQFTQFEGASQQPVKTIQYTTTIPSSGNFTTSIPTDSFLPGFCHWQLETIDYAFSYKQFKIAANSDTSIAFTHSKVSHPQKQLSSSWTCSQNRCQVVSLHDMSQSLSLHHNHRFHLTFQDK